MLIEFTHDGRHKGWRYRKGERVELYDQLAQQAIDDGMAKLIRYTRMPKRDYSEGRTNAAHAISSAQKRD